MAEATTIAVDLAKNVFEVAVSKEPGRVCERRRLSRIQMERFFANRPQSTVLLEACGSAHHWGRVLEGQGHRVVLLPAGQVRRYRHGEKTDRADAKALLEAYRNEQIVRVPIKSVAQQAMASVHRLRSAWMQTRTARLNAVRGLLREVGVTIPKGAHQVVPRLRDVMSKEMLPAALGVMLTRVAEEIGQMEKNIRDAERQLKELGQELASTERLRTIPGIGLLSATAMVAAIGEPTRFRSGRRMAAFVGLVPREHSSGERRVLGRISKRGDPYLRTLLTHGARSVLLAAKRSKRNDRLRRWALGLQERRGHNRATIALANKITRIAWAVWSRGVPYRSEMSEENVLRK